MELSMHAIDGRLSDSTIKIKGQIKGRLVMVLIDSGSTHSFLDSGTASELKLDLTLVPRATVAVADGRKLVVKVKCLGCVWLMQGHKFQFDLRTLELKDYDMILGVDWMKSCTPVTFDFEQNRLVVKNEGKMVELKGLTEETSLKKMGCKEFKRLIKNKWQGITMRLLSISPKTVVVQKQSSASTEFDQGLAALLQRYQSIFSDPVGLPPFRQIDHQIVLKNEV